jgi:hypothetical protein
MSAAARTKRNCTIYSVPRLCWVPSSMFKEGLTVDRVSLALSYTRLSSKAVAGQQDGMGMSFFTIIRRIRGFLT